MKILLLDNNQIDLFINERVLNSIGISQIHSFLNPIKALEYLVNLDEYPDIILTDVYLEPISGFDFYDKITRDCKLRILPKLVVLTVSINPSHIEEAKKRGICYIEKPLTVNKIKTFL